MMKRYLAVLLLSSSCFAAPFCVLHGSLKSCFYYSVSSCQEAANRMDGMCVPNDEERPNHSEPHTNNSLQKMLEAGERLGESIQQAREQERATQSHEQTMLEKEVEHQMRYDNDSLYRAAYDKVMERKAAESAPKPANPKTSPKPAYNGAAIFSVIVIFAGIAAVSMIATN